jgi:hypothetical protein
VYPNAGGFNVTTTDAIYIYSSAPIVFNPGPSGVSAATYSFSTNWNTFSRPLSTPMTVGELHTDIELSTGVNSFEKIAVYRGGEWVIYDFPSNTCSGSLRLSSTELLSPNTGYFLKFLNSGTWILK